MNRFDTLAKRLSIEKKITKEELAEYIHLVKDMKNQDLKQLWYQLDVFSERQIKAISNFGEDKKSQKNYLKLLPLHMLYLNKSLEELTEKETEAFRQLLDPIVNNYYTYFYLEKLRSELGENIILKRKNNAYYQKIIQSSKCGHDIEAYIDYLNAFDSNAKTVRNKINSIYKLNDFFELHGEFHENEFIDYLEKKGCKSNSIYQILNNTNQFLEWLNFNKGTNHHTISKEKMRRYDKISKKEREEEDGLAFKNIGIPQDVVLFLKSYAPQNEKERLALNFWKIIASCPVRKKFVMELEYKNCLYPMLNNEEVHGLYSKNHDKAGNKNGQFIVFDSIGIEAVKDLEGRITFDFEGFKPLRNEENARDYIHLFQLKSENKVMNSSDILDFKVTKIIPYLKQLDKYKEEELDFGTHAFRHYILTHIASETANEKAAVKAAGHKDAKMLRNHYLQSSIAKETLLYKTIERFEEGKISGKFHDKILEAILKEDYTSELGEKLLEEMEFEEFLQQNARKTSLGYCFEKEQSCMHYMKCWSCPSFLVKREEIDGAIKTLKQIIIDMEQLKKNKGSDDNFQLKMKNKIKYYSLVVGKLKSMNYTDEQIKIMLKG